MNVFSEKIKIEWTLIDPSGRAAIFSLLDFFQKAAIQHAELLGVGREPLEARGIVWMLSRVRTVIKRRPAINEEIVLRTWPRGFERLFAVRDYDITDSNGDGIVLSRAHWLLVDIEKRRPLRPENLNLNLPLNEGLNALDSPPPALGENNAAEFKAERRAAYSDIDFNGHVNNARYIQWLQDLGDSLFGDGALESSAGALLDINYISEVKRGEIVQFLAAKIENGFFIEGKKSSGGAAFRAELSLQN